MTTSDPLVKLRQLRKQYEFERQGHRKKLVQLICQGFKYAVALQKNAARRKAFFDLVDIPAQRRDSANLVIEVLAYTMCANSKSKRKMVSKRARAAQYLYESGVRIADLKREIHKRGGVEAVAREAAEKAPKRKAAPHIRPSSLKRGKAETEEPAATSMIGKASMRPLRNDERTLVLLEIQMSDLDLIRDLKVAKRAKLIVRRLPNGSGKAIGRVKAVKALS